MPRRHDAAGLVDGRQSRPALAGKTTALRDGGYNDAVRKLVDRPVETRMIALISPGPIELVIIAGMVLVPLGVGVAVVVLVTRKRK